MPNRKQVKSAGAYTIAAPKVVTRLYRKNGSLQGTYPRTGTATVVPVGEASQLIDQIGTGGNFRNCHHVKTVWTDVRMSSSDPAQTGTASGYETASPTAITHSRVDGLGVHARAVASGVFVQKATAMTNSINGVDWSALGAQALDSMLPGISPGVSLLNFLHELKDFRNVAKSLTNRFNGRVDSLRAVMRRQRVKPSIIDDIFDSRDAKNSLQRLSQRYLSWNFGWRPFFMDCRDMVMKAFAFDKQLRELIRRQRIPQQRYWGTYVSGTEKPVETLQVGTNVSPPGGVNGFFSPVYNYKVVAQESKGIRYHATMRYRYTLPVNISVERRAMMALLDAFGVKPDLGILWNAIPFSFLIDWVTNFGKIVDRIEADNLQIKTQIIEFCASARVQRDCSLEMSRNYMENGVVKYTNHVEYARCRKTEYKRVVGIPPRLGSLSLGSLSLNEAALSAALVGSAGQLYHKR